MDFTIITPSLNYARYLGDCLESTASQTGVSLEHLIFDAGSTDGSAEIAKKFPHTTWVQEPDKGMSHAINKGFAQAKGDWVIWLNADDRLKPGILTKILPRLKTTPADLIYGDWDFIDEDGRFIRSVKTPHWSPFIHIHHHCYIGSTAAFYRNMTVISEKHFLREDFRYVMDGEFYARLHSLGKTFERIPFNIADFRLHEENTSQRHLEKTRDIETILKAETQHIESRTIRRVHGITLFSDPYLNGLADGLLWILAKTYKVILKKFTKSS